MPISACQDGAQLVQFGVGDVIVGIGTFGDMPTPRLVSLSTTGKVYPIGSELPPEDVKAINESPQAVMLAFPSAASVDVLLQQLTKTRELLAEVESAAKEGQP